MSIQYKNSDILTVPNVAALFSIKNIKDNQLVQTLGYSTEGVGANLYRYDMGSSATIDGGFVLPGPNGTLSFSGTTFNGNAGDGGRFIAVDQTVADMTKFGAIGDGVASGSTWTGTDNWSAIQRCINWSIDNNIHIDIILPDAAGSYLVSDTLLIGKLSGGAWVIVDGVTLRGASKRSSFPSQTNGLGPIIQATFYDRPVVAIQSARRAVIEDVDIYSASNFQSRSGSVWSSGDTQDLTLKATSFIDTTNTARSDRYSPSCAVAVDPYGSMTPSGNRYPNTSTSYYVGNSNSSSFAFRRVTMGAARVGLLLGVGVTAGTSEGDIDHCFFTECYHAVASCHSQVKAIVATHCRAQYCKSVFCGSLYGDGTGNCGVKFKDFTGGAILSILDYSDLSKTDGLVFDGGLYEIVGTLGLAHQGYGSSRRYITFKDVALAFAMESAVVSPAFDGTSTFTLIDHGFVDGEQICIHPGLGPVFYKSVRYYIVNATANTFQLQYNPGTPPSFSGATGVIDFATSAIAAGTLEVFRPHFLSGQQTFEKCSFSTNRTGSGRAISIAPMGAGYTQAPPNRNGSDITQTGHQLRFNGCSFNLYGKTALTDHISFETWASETTSRWVEFDECYYVGSSSLRNRLHQIGWSTMARTWNDDQRMSVVTFTANDATPTVFGARLFKTANSSPTTITTFDDPQSGQEIKVIFNDSNTIVDFTGTNLKGNAGVDFTAASGDHMTCIYDGTNWYCDISDNTA